MSEKINWSVSIQVLGGPKISASQTLTVDAYDKIDVVIADGASGEDVEVQPGSTGQVQFLLIKSVKYGADLTYSVNAAEADSTKRIKLDSQQIFTGEGNVGLLGTSPQKLYFYNSLGEDAAIQILVGRKAVTP